MAKLTRIQDYRDSDGNTIVGSHRRSENVSIDFRGKNNRLTVDPAADLARLAVVFHGDHGSVTIGGNPHLGKPKLSLRVGHGGSVTIGDDVSTTTPLFVSAVEWSSVTIGDDVMFATHVQLRTGDSHAIYGVASGDRVNPAQDITIGDHVWMGYESIVLGGSSIGSGSVIGMRSLVTSNVANNCVAVGSPARTVRRDIAWERPYLWRSERAVDAAGAGIDMTAPHWRPSQDEPAP